MDDLKPFLSVVILHVPEDFADGHDQILELATCAAGDPSTVVSAESDSDRAFVHYTVDTSVPWARDLTEVVNHLSVVYLHRRYAAFGLTETRERNALLARVGTEPFEGFSAVSQDQMERALISGGKARTLWLRGIHASVPHKPDSKLLSGTSLLDALDPLGDQTYRYTAARAAAAGATIGVAINESRIWMGRTRGMEPFAEKLRDVFHRLDDAAAADDESRPAFAVLASARPDLTGVRCALEVLLTPPELFDPGPGADQDELIRLERLAYDTTFLLQPDADGPDFSAGVLLDGEQVGSLALKFKQENARVVHEVEVLEGPENPETLEEVAAILENPRALTVHYDSDHTLQAGQVARVRHRDMPFNDWRWDEFTKYEIGVEKPWDHAPPSAEEAAKLVEDDTRTLFGWVHDARLDWLDTSSGWLLCDDRAGETCDFLHLSPDRMLTLIHAKGAHKSKSKTAVNGVNPERGVAAGAYELVVAQAVKNLRHLDVVLLQDGLAATVPEGLEVLVWHNGERSDRTAFVQAAADVDHRVMRRVVIVQPHQRKSLLEELRQPLEDGQEEGQDRKKLKQLDTLLLGARANCNSVGAELIVVGHDDPPS